MPGWIMLLALYLTSAKAFARRSFMSAFFDVHARLVSPVSPFALNLQFVCCSDPGSYLHLIKPGSTQFLHPAQSEDEMNIHQFHPINWTTTKSYEIKNEGFLKGHEEDIHFSSACQDLSARPVWKQCSQDLNLHGLGLGEREFTAWTSWGTKLDRSGYLGGLFFFCRSTPPTP